MKVFEPATIGAITLANHFVRSATGEGLATGHGCCSPLLTKLMVQLARGGVGLIITGHTAVSKEGRKNGRQLCLWHKDHLPALIDMTEQVHEAGGKIVLQLSHAGIFANTSETLEAALGPTSHPQNDGTICREMTRPDIRKTVAAFAVAAALAKNAGFDGVQIHAAHGYLLSSFLSPHYNHRRDEYGGTVENRARFLLEVLQAVWGSAGRDFPVLVKMNVSDFLPDGLSVDDMLKTAALLEIVGVTAIELSGGTAQSGKLIPARPGEIKPENEGYYKEEARYFKEKIGIPLILVGGFRSLPIAENFLRDGICDFIAMSRPLISEPDLIARWWKNDKNHSSCKSDNLCYLPVRAGKGLYCLTQAREAKKTRGKNKTLYF
jgi:2,4-dienoyl-CoA reductase-like NADH-dependent reductase (Old Yellow Enzyme family)